MAEANRPSAQKYGRRTVNVSELRASEEGVLSGYAAVFNSLSEDLGGFREVIRPGSFRKTVQEADIRALWGHNDLYVLGRTNPQMREQGCATLELSEDATGLQVRISPPDTQWARDLRESVRRGDISQMSFGFQVIQDNWRDDKTGLLRELREVRLLEVSLVAFPAYAATSIQARDMHLAAEGFTSEEIRAALDMFEAKRAEKFSTGDEHAGQEPISIESKDDLPAEPGAVAPTTDEVEAPARLAAMRRLLDLKTKSM